jgi:hypothetical protein
LEEAEALCKKMGLAFSPKRPFGFETGNPERAVASFQNEKTLFPESRSYMDRLISRFKK